MGSLFKTKLLLSTAQSTFAQSPSLLLFTRLDELFQFIDRLKMTVDAPSTLIVYMGD